MMEEQAEKEARPEGGEWILALETATGVSSVAIYQGGALMGLYEFHTDRLHARLISVMVDRLLTDLGLQPSALAAVGMGSGPGSYTGLRVGVSVAKGLCMALDIPLLAINSLESLAWSVEDLAQSLDARICAMIDARRMEVFLGCFDREIQQQGAISAHLLEIGSLDHLLAEGRVLFVGDGVEKAIPLLEHHPNALPLPHRRSSAGGMGKALQRRFLTGMFEDLVLFEPFYLKDFVVTQSKKKYL
jgi:tRNA threonylcarbamoyladenosine biosynthesis protein TsaB